MSRFVSEIRSTEEGRLLHDFMCEKFPKGMDAFDITAVFFNCDGSEVLKKQKDEFYSSFEIWKIIKSLKQNKKNETDD